MKDKSTPLERCHSPHMAHRKGGGGTICWETRNQKRSTSAGSWIWARRRRHQHPKQRLAFLNLQLNTSTHAQKQPNQIQWNAGWARAKAGIHQ